jgi:hypothetical protein
MQSVKKGLIVHSTNVCAGERRANAQLDGHNGKRSTPRPEMRAVRCGRHDHRHRGGYS